MDLHEIILIKEPKRPLNSKRKLPSLQQCFKFHELINARRERGTPYPISFSLKVNSVYLCSIFDFFCKKKRIVNPKRID